MRGSVLKRMSIDCGPMLWATRSLRCINSATLSLLSKTGAGGVMRMFGATGLSFPALVARTATSAGASIANKAQIASNTKPTRVFFDFFISVLQTFSGLTMAMGLELAQACCDGQAVALKPAAFRLL